MVHTIATRKSQAVENEKNMTNEELLTEVLDLAAGDDWDGGFTDFGRWHYEYLELKLRERLSEWLKADEKLVLDNE